MRRSPGLSRMCIGLGGGLGLLSALLFACGRILGIEPGHERQVDASTESVDAHIDRDAALPPLGKVDASCGDTTKDPTNCGECGRDCRGGECKSGRCSPYVFVLNQTRPGPLAVTSEGVYWAYATDNGSGVRGCDLAGCKDGIPRTLFERSGAYYSTIAVQDDRLYAVRYNGIDTCNTLGCGGTPNTIVVNSLSLSLTPQQIYYAAPATSSSAGVIPGGVFRCSPPSCTSKTNIYPKGQGVRALGADIYVVDEGGPSGGTVIRCVGANCSVPTVLASGLDYPQSTFVAAKQGIGWMSYKNDEVTLVVCEPTSCAGGPQQVAKLGGYISSFAFDETYLYWVNNEYSTVERVPWKAKGLAPELLLSNQGLPIGIAMQDGALYFSRQEFGDIVRYVPPP